MKDNKMEASKECFVCRARSGVVFTPREEEVLEAIRGLTLRFRILKRRLKELKASGKNPDEVAQLEEELEALRKERQNLERERIEAARERMRILGHE
ncbi:hypothetical protein [Thermodesulforhabdus norvegica]|uniref:Uncharacterized protein n=1 Tax=Thermodesulforhabdus norvegica TaxID=39841 RepID=A0A1I4V6P1_9BACT|nr:hypothetical protein [Thermodesulforhabdus norvegica]SFM96848.1 hypothetical protein SAMN05660836_02137 [Thermodesulforhabdus norvegica]